MAYAGSESSKRCCVSGGGYGDMPGDGWMDGPLAVWVERERVNRAEMASDCAELMLIDLAEETDLELSGFVASSRHLETFMHDRAPVMIQRSATNVPRQVLGSSESCGWKGPFAFVRMVRFNTSARLCARLCAERKESGSAPARPLDHRRARCGA